MLPSRLLTLSLYLAAKKRLTDKEPVGTATKTGGNTNRDNILLNSWSPV
jgi:hypothetical protein